MGPPVLATHFAHTVSVKLRRCHLVVKQFKNQIDNPKYAWRLTAGQAYLINFYEINDLIIVWPIINKIYCK